MSAARSVLDVGCGVYPLQFPFAGAGRGVETYTALDRDPIVLQAVAALARLLSPGRLTAVRWELADGWDALPGTCRRRTCTYDLALMLKLVPVIVRQAAQALPVLLQVPALTVVVSGSCVALTRRRSIRRREEAVLRRFADQAARPVLGEFTAGEEFCLVLGPKAGWMV